MVTFDSGTQGNDGNDEEQVVPSPHKAREDVAWSNKHFHPYLPRHEYLLPRTKVHSSAYGRYSYSLSRGREIREEALEGTEGEKQTQLTRLRERRLLRAVREVT